MWPASQNCQLAEAGRGVSKLEGSGRSLWAAGLDMPPRESRAQRRAPSATRWARSARRAASAAPSATWAAARPARPRPSHRASTARGAGLVGVGVRVGVRVGVGLRVRARARARVKGGRRLTQLAGARELHSRLAKAAARAKHCREVGAVRALLWCEGARALERLARAVQPSGAVQQLAELIPRRIWLG